MRPAQLLRLSLVAGVAGTAALEMPAALAAPLPELIQNGVDVHESSGNGQVEVDDPRFHSSTFVFGSGHTSRSHALNFDTPDHSDTSFNNVFNDKQVGTANWQIFGPSATRIGQLFGSASIDTSTDPGTRSVGGSQSFTVRTGLDVGGDVVNTSDRARDYQLHVHIADTQLRLATSRESLIATAGKTGLANAALPNTPSVGAGFAVTVRQGKSVLTTASVDASLVNGIMQGPTANGLKVGSVDPAGVLDIPDQDRTIDLGTFQSSDPAHPSFNLFDVEFDQAFSGDNCTPVPGISANSCFASFSTGTFDGENGLDIDNVSLTSTPVDAPTTVAEPAMLGILSTGFLGLARLRRRPL